MFHQTWDVRTFNEVSNFKSDDNLHKKTFFFRNLKKGKQTETLKKTGYGHRCVAIVRAFIRAFNCRQTIVYA